MFVCGSLLQKLEDPGTNPPPPPKENKNVVLTED